MELPPAALHFLRDYRPPAWRADAIELVFDLDPESTLVTARFEARRAVAGAAPLVLDAEDLELLTVRIEGVVDPAARVLDGALTVPVQGERAWIEVEVRLTPASNTTLQGLYTSDTRDGVLMLTQCEAEGFRRIAPFFDRPDVSARYVVTLRADAARFPLLLASGTREAGGVLDDGRHWARFVDPQPKPSYLFALVAGNLGRLDDRFVTRHGRTVALAIHAERSVIARCAQAMAALKAAMQWDEQRFGRVYGLDAYHIVATHDFAMGAMENQGLNLFNARYLLADAEHATDDDHRHVQAVVGHEYFHDWSGNRVTCRDWFQLCLKEGLTVYREQEFASDIGSRTLRRIEDVRALWRTQYPEDAGPLAHPVRPDRYAAIDNFYTATVYEKGAEIVRMLARVLGREGFRKGLDLYFDRHDGQAATVEDFLAALGEANGTDLSRWLDWYAQAGTPELAAEVRHDPARRCLELTLRQRTAPTPNQPHKVALPIPVAVALFDAAGRPLPLRLDGETAAHGEERVLLLREHAATFRFVDVAGEPVLSLLRDHSAPVRLRMDETAAALALRMRHDSDPFNRWLAADRFAHRLFAQTLAEGEPDPDDLAAYLAALRAALADPTLDPAVMAEMLTLPDAVSLTDGRDAIDPEAVHRARNGLETALALALHPQLRDGYQSLGCAPGHAQAASRRRLRNACLAALCRHDAQCEQWAWHQFSNADTLTDRLAALSVLAGRDQAAAERAFEMFFARHGDEALVADKGWSVRATVAEPWTVDRVRALVEAADYRWTNPNRVYATLGAFAWRNLRAFHRNDGAGYRLLADAIIRLDLLTPQVAARLATAFGDWRRMEPVRRALLRHELRRLAARGSWSPDVADILKRTLAPA